jgi:hypothetical protein
MKYMVVLSLFVLLRYSIPFAAQDSAATHGAPAPAVQKPSADQAKVAPGQTSEEEDLLIDETETKKNVQIAPDAAGKNEPAQLVSDSLKSLQKNAGAESPKNDVQITEQKIDSAARSSSTDTSVAPTNKPAETVTAPATVESIHSVNFAKNLKDYRSPKLAMFMSLLVPGLGQAYVKRYYKTGVFLALEATAIGFSVAFNNKGKQKETDAKKVADDNFEYDKMMGYYNGLKSLIIQTPGIGENNPDSAAEAKRYDIYLDSGLTSFTQASKAKSQEFYRTIETNAFVQGWKDCQPDTFFILGLGTADSIIIGGFKYKKNDTLRYKVMRIDTGKGKSVDSTLLYGYSPKQDEFSQAMSKSNGYYKTARNILFSMVFNHILSAVDALISAKAYNDELIGKESVWRHVSIEQEMVDAGSHSVPGCSLKFRF